MTGSPGIARGRVAGLRAWGRNAPAVKAVLLEGFFTRLGFGIVTLYLPLYALELGMSLTEVGLLVGAKALVVPAVKPVMGVVVDRFGARRGYLAAVGLRFLGALLLLAAATPAALLAVRFVQGAASAARDPASVTVLAKQAQARLGRTFSAAIGAKDLGNISAGVVGGTVLALSGGDFGVLWVAVAVLAAVPVLAVWRWVPAATAVDQPAPAAPDVTEAAAEQGRAAASVLRSPHLRRIAALGMCTGLTAHLFHGLFQVYASEVAGLSAGTIGAVYSLSIVTLLVVGPVAGWAADRFGTGPLGGVRGLANALSSMIFLAAPSLGGVVAGRLVDDAGKAAFRPTWGALVGGAAREAGPRGGRVAAGLDTALSVGEALGPLLAGLLWDTFGVAVFLVVRAVLGVGTEVVVGRRLRGSAPAAPHAAHHSPPLGTDGGWAEGEDAAAAVVDTAAEPRGRVEQALRARRPDAVPEELARAWARAGLDVLGSLDAARSGEAGVLPPPVRARLALAAALVGDPSHILLTGPHAEELLPVLDRYPGTVVADVPARTGAPERPPVALSS
ncbi:MAG TPA: MFS transporter [Egibacteraceae bacterium]|nr:MFS transporter [Egibacteraceae bacterium]